MATTEEEILDARKKNETPETDEEYREETAADTLKSAEEQIDEEVAAGKNLEQRAINLIPPKFAAKAAETRSAVREHAIFAGTAALNTGLRWAARARRYLEDAITTEDLLAKLTRELGVTPLNGDLTIWAVTDKDRLKDVGGEKEARRQISETIHLNPDDIEIISH